MDMYVSADSANLGTALTAGIILDNLATYFLICEIRQATTTNLAITGNWNGDLGSSSASSISDVAGAFADLLTARQFSLAGDYANCNMNLKCEGINDANRLLGESATTDREYQMKVRCKYIISRSSPRILQILAHY